MRLVKDVTAPAIAAPPGIVVEATSAAGAAVTFAIPAATDAVGVTSVSCTPSSASIFPIGTTTVMCRASDAANNTATSSFSVLVPGHDGTGNRRHCERNGGEPRS